MPAASAIALTVRGITRIRYAPRKIGFPMLAEDRPATGLLQGSGSDPKY